MEFLSKLVASVQTMVDSEAVSEAQANACAVQNDYDANPESKVGPLKMVAYDGHL